MSDRPVPDPASEPPAAGPGGAWGALLRLLRAAGRATAYVLAALYFLLDEALASVRRLARYLAPLAWYFNAVKTMRNALRRHGMRHPSGWVRQATPFATLPFIIVPGLLLIPAKLYFAALLVTRPLYAGGGLVAAKFVSAIFVKGTWDILRPLARMSAVLAWFDDRWLALERWAKLTLREFKTWLRSSAAYRWLAESARSLRLRLALVLRPLLARARAWLLQLGRRLWGRPG